MGGSTKISLIWLEIDTINFRGFQSGHHHLSHKKTNGDAKQYWTFNIMYWLSLFSLAWSFRDSDKGSFRLA